MKHRKSYKTYTREFKQEAVRLMETTDKPAVEVAIELGIQRNQLYKWKQQLALKGDAAFSGAGRPRAEYEPELAVLKRENERLREESDILKDDAAAIAAITLGQNPLTQPPPRERKQDE